MRSSRLTDGKAWGGGGGVVGGLCWTLSARFDVAAPLEPQLLQLKLETSIPEAYKSVNAHT